MPPADYPGGFFVAEIIYTCFNMSAFTEEEQMRTVLFSLFLSACHVGYLSEQDGYEKTIAENATEITCGFYSKNSIGKGVNALLDEYAQLDTSSGVILAFFHGHRNADDLAFIESDCDCMEIASSSPIEIDEEEYLYYTEFSIDLTTTTVNAGVSTFFTDQGELDLLNDEEVWLFLWSSEETDLGFFEVLVSQAGEKTSYCELVL
jgi:hypothetical protein